jgi:hypothetical protein
MGDPAATDADKVRREREPLEIERTERKIERATGDRENREREREREQN